MELLLEFINNHPMLALGCVGFFLLAVFNELKIKEANICGLSTTDSVKLINQNSLIFDVGPAERYAKNTFWVLPTKNQKTSQKKRSEKTIKKTSLFSGMRQWQCQQKAEPETALQGLGQCFLY